MIGGWWTVDKYYTVYYYTSISAFLLSLNFQNVVRRDSCAPTLKEIYIVICHMDTTASNPQTETPKPPDPELVDRGRWSGNVIGETTTTYEWGTYTFVAQVQLFDDGEGHVQVTAPSSAPPTARDIVADGLASLCPTERAIAAVLADGWGIETDEVTLDV